MFEYGYLPSLPFFIFCILVLALSKGNEMKAAKKPAIALALLYYKLLYRLLLKSCIYYISLVC